MNSQSPIPHPPVHFLSAMAVIGLDMIWGFLETGVSLSFVGIILVPLLSLTVGGIAFLAVSFTQYFLAGDHWGPAIAKGLVMGILAAVPFPIMGTAIGAPLLAWAGLKRLTG